jgi:RNA polymerase sigma-70 factor (ECF subfamily)
MDLRSTPSSELSQLCIDGSNAEAWLEFVRRYQKPIALTALRICRLWGEATRTIVDDLVQETYLRICANGCRVLRAFTPRPDREDSLADFVVTVAASVCHDHFRGQRAQKRGGSNQSVTQDSCVVDLFGDSGDGANRIERGTLLGEVERLLSAAPAASIPARERMIFKLYFHQGLSARAIAAIPSLELSTKGVESAIHRVTLYLRSQLRSRSRDGEPNWPMPDGGSGV